MNIRRPAVAFAFLISCAFPLIAAQRSFVASSGSDSNPCSRDLPCRSFNTAIGATTAGGEVVALDSAGYGVASINGSITIVGAPGVHAGVSAFTGSAITVNAGTTNVVTVRNLYINGLGATIGIDAQVVGTLHIDHCTVANFSSQDVNIVADEARVFIDDTTIREGDAYGILANATTAPQLIIVNTNVERVLTGYGVAVGNANVTIRASSISGCGDGVLAFDTGVGGTVGRVDIESSNVSGNFFAGIFAVGNCAVSIHDSVIAENGDDGIRIEGSSASGPSRVSAHNCAISNQPTGVLVAGSGQTLNTAILSNCQITQNSSFGVEVASGNNQAVLTGNTITLNGTGVDNSGSVFSAGDNAIHSNTTDVNGTALTSFAKQ